MVFKVKSTRVNDLTMSLKYLIRVVELIGLCHLRSDKNHPTWRVKSHRGYVYCMHTLCIVFLTLEALSIILRAVRYLPELFIKILEETLLLSTYLTAFFFYSLQREILLHMVDFLDVHFEKFPPRYLKKCQDYTWRWFWLFSIIIAFMTLLTVARALLPLPAEVMMERRTVYPTKYPDKRHPVDVYLYFIDESESWYYEVIFIYISYLLIFIFPFMAGAIITLIPSMVKHIAGQYEILSSFAVQLGKQHRDSVGCRIIYTNIERNEFVMIPENWIDFTDTDCKEPYKNVSYTEFLQRKRTEQFIKTLERDYERSYLKMIIQYHRKLLDFQEMVRMIFDQNKLV